MANAYPNIISITNVTNRQTHKHTDDATPLIAIAHILSTQCMQCGLITYS